MQNLSDDELDDLMRKASESQSHPYDADDWRKLAAKIESQPANAFARWKRPILTVAGIVTIGIGGWIAAELLSTTDVEVETLSETSETITSEEIKPQNTSETKPIVEKPAGEKQDDIGRQPEPSATNMRQPYNRPVNTANDSRSRGLEKTEDRDENEGTLQRAPNHTQVVLDNADKERSTTPGTGYTAKVSQVLLAVDSVTADSAIVAVVEKPMGISEDSVADDEKKSDRWSRLALKVSYSPDWSANKFGKTSTVGKTYGLFVEYYIARSLSVSAGFLYAQKLYTAENLEYSIYTAEYAEGECRMWDVPVAINYYLPSTSKLQFFASLGLSSYLMNNERYKYYPDATNPYLVYGDEFHKKNKDWFKILNVSLGAQLRVRPSLYLQVEPFVKAPLLGVGEWDIALSSIGTFVSLKFQPKLKHNETKRSR